MTTRHATLIDVVHERSLTEGCTGIHHFNAAGAALPSSAVVNAVVGHLRLEEQEGGYEAARMVTEQVEGIYGHAARLINASPEEIALFDSASSGLRNVVDALRLSPGHRLLLSRSTYVSHALHLMSLTRDKGVELVVLPNGPDGAADLVFLESLLSEGRNDVVCVAHVPTSSGLVEPAEAIGVLCARYRAVYILDATQSAGQLDLDVQRIGCDVLATTGRKFLRAPRGTGFTYVRQALLDTLAPWAPDVRGASWESERSWSLTPAARKLESWESSVACRLGLGVALEEALGRGMPATELHLGAVADSLRAGLSSLPGVQLADPEAGTSAIVTFTVPGRDQRSVGEALRQAGVSVLVVPASHAQYDLGARGLDAVVRASPHVYNDDADIAALLSAVEKTAAAAA